MEKKQNHNARLIGIVLAVILIAVLVLFFVMRGYDSPQVTSTETADSATSWVYVTDELRLLVLPTQDEATCSTEWLKRDPGTLAFFTINEAGERRTLNATISDTDCTITEDITNLDYIGITINDEDAGGLEAPVSDTSTAPMHVLFTLPDNPTTLYPTSGQWSYSMTATDANLTCVTGSGGISAAGSVDFVTANYGMTASFSTSSNAIFFTRAGYANPHYDTPQYSTVTGYVEYDLDVLDQEYMKGTLHMQGDVCSGDFLIEMTLEVPSGPPIYVPHQGSWNIQYAPLVCGNTPMNSSALINTPFGTAMLSVTGGGAVPMMLSFSGSPSGLTLNQSLGTNLYSGYPNMILGVANDALTGQPFQIIGNWNVTALSDSLMIGTLTVVGTNGCMGATNVVFENY